MTGIKPLAARTKDIKKAASIIADNMLASRPKADIAYRARRKSEYIYDIAPLGARCVDLKGIFPDAKKGDSVYVAAYLESEKDVRAAIKTSGVSKLFIDGIEYEIKDSVAEFDKKAGRSLAEFLCIAGDEFKMSFVPSVVYYPGMWARDYLAHIRAVCPVDGFLSEEGAAVTAPGGERGKYVYPEKAKTCNVIDFHELYGDEKGVYAYAIAYAAKDFSAKIDIKGKGKVIINGEASSCGSIKLKKDDVVIVKCERSDEWGVELSGDFYIPVIEDQKVLTVGTFGTTPSMDVKYGPEIYLDFKRPYRNAEGKRCFFKLGTKDDYLTAEMHTHFYSQWFYALMVGEYGLLDAAQLTGKNEYQQYFIESMSTMAELYELQKWQKETFGDSAFLQRGMNPEDLDSIGSIGMNMCELYNLTRNPYAAVCADMLIKAIDTIPRFEDGTFHRGATMWADDTYMSCPFMLRYGLMRGDEKWLEECARQLLGFAKKLFIPEKNVFSHIYFVNEKTPNRIPWGRGNGWVFVTLSELIEKLPPDTKGYEELVELFRKFAKGVVSLQGENGLWHQVLDIEASYEETSCTGMFIIGLSRGLRLGILTDEVKENIIRAYNGLMENKLDENGNVYDVCRGSWCSMEAKYYIRLGTVDNDDHGTGIILCALRQMESAGVFAR